MTPDGDIILTAANNFGPGEMSISTPGKLQISAAGGIILGKVGVGKTAELLGNGTINLGTATFNGDLKVNSGGFYITQSGPMYTGAQTNFDAGTAKIYLMEPLNVWKGGILYKGGIVQINHPQLLNAVSAGLLLVRVESTKPDAARPAPSVTSSKAASLGANITVAVGRKPSSTAPGLIDVQIAPEVAAAGSSFSFKLDPNALAEQPSDAEVRISQTDDKPMPDWLTYDAATKSFTATAVPAGAFPLQLKVSVGGVESVMVIQEKAKK